MTAIRSLRAKTSSRSSEISRTAAPASRTSLILPWIYSTAPTSKPRVGCAATIGSDLALRIYFYDDTHGNTGKIHVGFIGPHYLMPNTKS